MKILNDMECAEINNGKRYTLTNEEGKIEILHYDFDFGVSINVGLVDMPCYSTQEHFTEVNLIGALICMTGSLENKIGDDVHTQIPGTAVFGRPSPKKNTMRYPGGLYKGFAIGFKPEADLPKIGREPETRFMLAALKERFESKTAIPFKVPMEMMISAGAILHELLTNGGTNREKMRRRCAEVLYTLYYMGSPEFFKVPKMKNIEIVDRMCAELLDDLSVTPNIKNLCEDHGINEFWFIRNFKKRYGYTPYEYHKMAKLTYAAAMLLCNDYSIGEIAEMTGYASQSKFSMAFKELHECRPKHFQRYFEAKLKDSPRDDLFD